MALRHLFTINVTNGVVVPYHYHLVLWETDNTEVRRIKRKCILKQVEKDDNFLPYAYLSIESIEVPILFIYAYCAYKLILKVWHHILNYCSVWSEFLIVRFMKWIFFISSIRSPGIEIIRFQFSILCLWATTFTANFDKNKQRNLFWCIRCYWLYNQNQDFRSMSDRGGCS